MDKLVPTIEPIKIKQYEVKQSKYNQVARLPTSKILLGPSHSGKGVVMVKHAYSTVVLLMKICA